METIYHYEVKIIDREGHWRITPEESLKTHRQKLYEYNNNGEDNYLNPFSDKNNQVLSQKFSARGVVVIAVGNEHGDTSSNPGRYWLHFT